MADFGSLSPLTPGFVPDKTGNYLGGDVKPNPARNAGSSLPGELALH